MTRLKRQEIGNYRNTYLPSHVESTSQNCAALTRYSTHDILSIKILTICISFFVTNKLIRVSNVSTKFSDMGKNSNNSEK